MRRRTLWLGGANLFALGLALGLALAVISSDPDADNRPVPSNADSSGAAAAAPTPAAPHSADTKLNATVSKNGDAGGKVVIPVPPAEPELCTPVHITVVVGQTTAVACKSANYDGPITLSVADPAIASVSTSNSRMLPRYLVVVGHQAGTTILRVSYPDGPTTSYPITVSAP